jgi:hypothetical protein
MNDILNKIQNELQNISKHNSFKSWLNEKDELNEKDIIVVNNSFIFRGEVQTNKSNSYLGFKLNNEKLISGYYVIHGIKKNDVDFKVFSEQTVVKNKLAVNKLEDLIPEQLNELGKLVFVLLGKIDDKQIFSEEVNSDYFTSIELDPSVNAISINDSKLILNDTSDEENIWNFIVEKFSGNEDFETSQEALRQSVGKAIDLIEQNSFATLTIPEKISDNEKTVTTDLLDVLIQQIEDYQTAFEKCNGDPTKDKGSFNEVLRIAYNFSTDATTFIKLIVSICDIKPIVLWGTISSHYKLSESFRELPWTRSKNKPSLKNYIATVGNARNSAFHKFFPFRKTLTVQLPKDALKDFNLRIFSEYTNRSNNELSYTDKELVEVLIEFTRTNEHKISPLFWKKNLQIMKDTVNVFKATNEFLLQILPK